MALDFTIVFSVRQMFGNSEIEDIGLETQAPFVGLEKDYSFQCPGVDPSQQAILLFQVQGSMVQQSLQINGQEIFGGIPSGSGGFDTNTTTTTTPVENQPDVVEQFTDSVSYAQWTGNVMLIQPGVLRENNVMHIRASKVGNGIDNFIVDNVVIVYKTSNPDSGPVVRPARNQ